MISGLDHRLSLQVLNIIIHEIRSEDDIKAASMLADIFRNVPGMVLAGRNADDIFADVLRTADRYGQIEYIKKKIKNISEVYGIALPSILD